MSLEYLPRYRWRDLFYTPTSERVQRTRGALSGWGGRSPLPPEPQSRTALGTPEAHSEKSIRGGCRRLTWKRRRRRCSSGNGAVERIARSGKQPAVTAGMAPLESNTQSARHCCRWGRCARRRSPHESPVPHRRCLASPFVRRLLPRPGAPRRGPTH